MRARDSLQLHAGDTRDPARAHRALVAELAAVVGESRADELDVDAEVHFLMLQSSPEQSLAQARMQSALESMRAALGDEFTKRYYLSLHDKLTVLRDAKVAAAALPTLEQGTALFTSAEHAEQADEGVTDKRTGLDSIADEDLARVLKRRIGL